MQQAGDISQAAKGDVDKGISRADADLDPDCGFDKPKPSVSRHIQLERAGGKKAVDGKRTCDGREEHGQNGQEGVR